MMIIFGHLGNIFGQLCLGNKSKGRRQKIIKLPQHESKPKKTSFSNVLNIACGFYHSFFQMKNKIYGCGHNFNGELGLGNLITSKSTVYCIPNQPANIQLISCGFHHSLFLDCDGKVFSSGINSSGCLGYENSLNKFAQIPNIPPIKLISGSGYSSYLLDFDGNIWSFGFNDNGQLGFGDRENRKVPTKIPTIADVLQISNGCNGFHFLVKDSRYKIFSCGNNSYGQFGNGNLGNPDATLQEMNPEHKDI